MCTLMVAGSFHSGIILLWGGPESGGLVERLQHIGPVKLKSIWRTFTSIGVVLGFSRPLEDILAVPPEQSLQPVSLQSHAMGLFILVVIVKYS